MTLQPRCVRSAPARVSRNMLARTHRSFASIGAGAMRVEAGPARQSQPAQTRARPRACASSRPERGEESTAALHLRRFRSYALFLHRVDASFQSSKWAFPFAGYLPRTAHNSPIRRRSRKGNRLRRGPFLLARRPACCIVPRMQCRISTVDSVGYPPVYTKMCPLPPPGVSIRFTFALPGTRNLVNLSFHHIPVHFRATAQLGRRCRGTGIRAESALRLGPREFTL